MKEKLDFVKRTEEAYQRHERGDFTYMDAKKFLKTLRKW